MHGLWVKQKEVLLLEFEISKQKIPPPGSYDPKPYNLKSSPKFRLVNSV